MASASECLPLALHTDPTLLVSVLLPTITKDTDPTMRSWTMRIDCLQSAFRVFCMWEWVQHTCMHTLPFTIKPTRPQHNTGLLYWQSLGSVITCLILQPTQRAQPECSPAGLSVAAIDRVDTDTVIFRGADVVDGTPVLDIKPYIPYIDGGVGATAPEWVYVLYTLIILMQCPGITSLTSGGRSAPRCMSCLERNLCLTATQIDGLGCHATKAVLAFCCGCMLELYDWCSAGQG